jgi:hypothetical protein
VECGCGVWVWSVGGWSVGVECGEWRVVCGCECGVRVECVCGYVVPVHALQPNLDVRRCDTITGECTIRGQMRRRYTGLVGPAGLR